MGEPSNGTKSEEIERTAGSLFVLTFGAMIFSYLLYDRGMSWGLAALAVSVAAAVMFALSAILSRRRSRRRAKISLAAGMLGLAVSLASVVVIAMEYVSEHSN